MIKNLYTIVSGRYMGQGLIVCQQMPNETFSAVMWPSGRLIRVSKGQLENSDICQLLDCLPESVFAPYNNAHDQLIKQNKTHNTVC